MTLARLWVVLAVLLPVLASLIARISTVDLAYQLRAGAEILATGRIPTVDTWTFTVQGQPWLDQQWGAQVVLRLVESVGGWVGLAVFRAVLVGVIFGGTALIAVRRGLDIRTARGPVADRVRGRRPGSRPPPAAARHGVLRRGAPARRRSPRPPAAPLARPGHRGHLGQSPRLVLPRSAGARPRMARGPPRPRARGPADARS